MGDRATATRLTVVEELRAGAGTLRPGPRVGPQDHATGVHRARLVAGMAEAAAAKGFAAVTIADVVARAQVSRRTFYEHFADKDACFLATYEACAGLLMGRIAAAVEDAGTTWEERIRAGVTAYLTALAQEPSLTRVFLVDVLLAGPEALRRRRTVLGRYAELVRALAAVHREELPSGHLLEEPMATALIGAMNELVLLAVEEGRATELPQLADTAVRLVSAVLAPAG